MNSEELVSAEAKEILWELKLDYDRGWKKLLLYLDHLETRVRALEKFGQTMNEQHNKWENGQAVWDYYSPPFEKP